ncbi:Gfo/Idh/MocA family protein [Caldicellulosiruptoraceae bacterium PP1]
MKKINLGIIGCGNISDVYFRNCSKYDFLHIVACSDVNKERALEKAKQYNVDYVLSTEELIKHPEVDIVINLTPPKYHAQLNLMALENNKHVYCEKPITITLEDAQKVLELAKQKGLYVGCAPDTFLGAGLQTSRKVIEDGWIGDVIGFSAFVLDSGPESWHPEPEDYYRYGAGPLYCLAPYYITALVNLVGPVKKVTAMQKMTYKKRLITSSLKYGQYFDVEMPTFVATLMELENNVIGNYTTSYDVWATQTPNIEIYGTKGTLRVPDPNFFDGPVQIKTRNMSNWQNIPLIYSYTYDARGLGIADMADAILNNRKNRAHGDLAYHVLDVMHSIDKAVEENRIIEVKSTFEKPQLFETGLLEHTFKSLRY